MIPPSPTLLQALRRYWKVAVAGLLLGALAAIAFTVVFPPRSVAVAKLGLDDPRGSNVFRNANLSPTDLIAYAQGQANYASSETVLEAARQTLPDKPSLETMQTTVSVAVSSKSPTLEITATTRSDATSVARANAVAEAYKTLSGKATADDAATALKTISDSRSAVLDSLGAKGPDSAQGRAATTTLAALDQRAGEIRLAASLFNDGVSYTVSAAQAEVTHTGNPLRNLAAGLLLGLFAGAALALALAARFRPAEDPDELCDALGSQLLGILAPRRGELPVEQVEMVAAGLALRPGAVLTFVGARSTGALANAVGDLAVTLASWGHAVGVVLPVDEPVNGVRAQAGVVTSVRSGAGRVDVVGLPDPQAASQAVAELSAQCEVVLVVATSIDKAGAASLLLASGQSVLVVPQGLRWSAVHRAQQALSRFGATQLGVLFLAGPVRAARLVLTGPAASKARSGAPEEWRVAAQESGAFPTRASRR